MFIWEWWCYLWFSPSGNASFETWGWSDTPYITLHVALTHTSSTHMLKMSQGVYSSDTSSIRLPSVRLEPPLNGGTAIFKAFTIDVKNQIKSRCEAGSGREWC